MISWKWIVGLLILGLAELLLVVQLHQWFNVKMLVAIYLATTLLGIGFLKIMERYVFTKLHNQTTKFGKKARRRLAKQIKNSQVLTDDQQLHFKILMGSMLFIFALILIVMPGLLTDIIGIILVIPGLVNKLLDKAFVSYNQEALKKSSESE